MNALFAGATAAARGIVWAARRPEVRRAYVQLSLAMLVLMTALDVAGIALVLHWTTPTDPSDWTALLWLLLRVGGIVGVLLVAPVIAVVIAGLAFSLLAERVFWAALRIRDPNLTSVLQAAPSLSFRHGLSNSVRRLSSLLFGSLLGFALTFVPAAGAVLGPATQSWITSRILTWELLEPYLVSRGMDFATQREYLQQQRWAVFGFGLVCSLVLAVPLLGPLCFGLVQAAAAGLVVDVLAHETSSPPPVSGG